MRRAIVEAVAAAVVVAVVKARESMKRTRGNEERNKQHKARRNEVDLEKSRIQTHKHYLSQLHSLYLLQAPSLALHPHLPLYHPYLHFLYCL